MKYAGMPFGMWMLFAGSFQKQLTAVLGYDAATARAITKKAKPQYRQIIRRLPEFEKADRFKMNIVNCAMLGAFILSMPQRPEVDRLTDYYARSMLTKPMQPPTATPIRGTWSFTNTLTEAATRDALPGAASVC